MASKLEQNLQLLNFDPHLSSSALLFTNQTYNLNDASFGELLVLEEARQLDATAVFFRRSKDNRTSLPQVFIYDNTQNRLSNNDLVEIHRKLWSGDIVSVYYVVENTQVRIFDARKPVEYKNKNLSVDPLDTVDLVIEAQEQYQRYSARLFENGAFWEQKVNQDDFLYNESASKKLIEGLKDFRDHFVKQSDITLTFAHKVLVQSILVKYLEERRDKRGKSVFVEGFFSQFDGASNFCEVIRKGHIVTLFDILSAHFNGKIFELSESDKFKLNQIDLSSLANFLDANLDDQQYVLWRLYAFDYLPVELISRIYEEFIPQRDDAVYTPVHLTRFMVDQCMPLEIPQENHKIIDVSCGSGIFLVTAFKRLVQWWQKQRYDQTGKIEHPDSETLQSILRESVYGVDIEPEAIQLSAFSLSIALCDMLDPTEIWLNLKFNDLEEESLYTGDFFEYLGKENNKDFDLVIGNPPFRDKSKEVKTAIEKYNLKISYDIPRDQIALLFLQQAMFLLKENGLLCLVMPAGPLIYNNTLEYRRDFFSRYEIPQIIDLSALKSRGYLFERAVSTAVIFANNHTPSKDHDILHLTIKRSTVAKERHYFEVDHYDMHFVPQEIAVSDPIIWKTNLWGGSQLYYLVKRLINSRSLKDYLKGKKKNNGWFYGEGYNLGNKSKRATHITDKPMVETSKFTEEGILEITIESEEWFEGTRERNRQIFNSPHLLIKETPGANKFVTAYIEDYLVFRHEIIGIHAPWGQENELKNLEATLQKNYALLKMLLLTFSNRAGVSRSLSTVLMQDFMRLPYPEDGKVLELSRNEQMILQDVLNYSIEEYGLGEKAQVNTSQVTNQQLAEFGETFCHNLNSIYQVENKLFYPLKPLYGPSYICFRFTYGDQNDQPNNLELPTSGLENLLEHERDKVKYQRVAKAYQENIVSLIKPKNLRYWLKSIAIRDATEVMQDLVESGY
jgi:type I restriction-modification system DNA methylase subunit